MSEHDAVVLHWRDLAQPGSEYIPLRIAPAPNQGFFENGSYAFRKPTTGWNLLVDDEPLPEKPGDTTVWTWAPGFYAGEVTAELLRPDGTRAALFLLDVSPHARKLGREVFAEMVQDLLREAPDLVLGTEPARHEAGELGAGENPWVAFARLRRYGPQLVQALRVVQQQPRRALRGHREQVAPHHVRRVDQRTATAALRGSAVALFDESPDTCSAIGREIRVDVPVVHEVLDCAANRTLAALAQMILRRARFLETSLAAEVQREQDSSTETMLSRRWPGRRAFLQAIAADLRAALRRSPLSDVARSEVSAAGLTAIAADPVYCRAWGMGWRALRQGVGADQLTDRLWISPTWKIYEGWCFLKVGRLLASQWPAFHWQRLSDPHRWEGNGDGVRVKLLLQPSFRSLASAGDKGMWSVSKEREPDLVITVERGSEMRFVVLDAKYRASCQNVLDAMSSAHIYQDSLRIKAQRPAACVLLIPAGGGAAWLESPDFVARHRVGAHPFCSHAIVELPAVVQELIEDLHG